MTNPEVERIKQGQLSKIQCEALTQSLLKCIQACYCPTCGALPNLLCRNRKSGKVVPTHSTRTQAGHALLATPVAKVADAMREFFYLGLERE